MSNPSFEVLNNKHNEDRTDYTLFVDCLALWAREYIMPLAAQIMARAEDLYECASVRVLLTKWQDARRRDIDWQRRTLTDIALNNMSCDSIHEDSPYAYEARVYKQALYALIIG